MKKLIFNEITKELDLIDEKPHHKFSKKLWKIVWEIFEISIGYKDIDKNDSENSIEDSRVEYESAKSKIKNIKRAKKVTLLILLSAGIVVLILGGVIIQGQTINLGKDWANILTVGIVPFLFAAFAYSGFEMAESDAFRKIAEYQTEYIQEESQNDIFESSIKMSYKYLDQYYLQTREQAQRGFIITVIISIFGAVLIAIGVMAMFLEKTDPSYITCGAGVIIEFISAIFFYLYNKTVASMSDYHNKLVLSHNVSIALKVSDSLEGGDKVNAKNTIINELLKDINIHLISSDGNIKNSDNE